VDLADSQPFGSDVASTVQSVVNEFNNVTGIGIFELASTVTQPTNSVVVATDGAIPGYGIIDAQGILGTNYGLTFMRSAGGATTPLWIVSDSCTFVAGVRSLVTPAGGGHPTGIVKLGTGSENVRKTRIKVEILGAAYAAASGNTVKDITTGSVICGFYTDCASGAYSIYECDIDISLKTIDVGIFMDEQVNANTWKVMSKDCGRHIYMDGGASEVLENLILFNCTQGITFSTGTATVFTLRNICKFNQFYGISEIFGQVWDVTGGSLTGGFNTFKGSFNELTFSDPGASNTQEIQNSREFHGRTTIKDSVATSPAVPAATVEAYPWTAASFQSNLQVLSETAQVTGAGGGIAFGGYFTTTDKAQYGEI
jgi:hypothetical protein